MKTFRTCVVTVVSTLALGPVALAAAPAFADDTDAAPCSTQQTQLDRAAAKLAALTVKLAEHPTQKNQKAKKAQVKRVEKAQARLDACVAGTADPADPEDD